MGSMIARRRRWHDAAAIVAALTVLGWFWGARIVRPARAMTFAGADLFTYFVPMHALIGESWRALHVPLWNPYQSCGEPLLAVLQGAAMYPARLLLLVMSPSAALGWSTFLHLAIAAIGMFALPRALGMGIAASLTASIAFTYGFAAPAIYAPSTFLEPGVWWPVAALAVLRVVETRRWCHVLLASFAMAAPILAGGYQVAVYSFYGLALFGLGLVLEQRTRASMLTADVLVRLGTAAVLAVMLSSVQWLPTVLWTRETVRSTHALSVAQIDPWNSDPATVAAMLVARRDVLTAIFLPPPVIALAFAALLFGRREVRPLTIGGCIAFLLSLGAHTAWFPLYYLLPGFSMFRLPGRLHYLVVLASALAAAAGVEVVQRWSRPAARVRLAIALLAVATGIVLTYRSMPPAKGQHRAGVVGATGALLSGRPELGVDAFDLVSGVTALGAAALPPSIAGPAALAPIVISAIGSRRNDSLLPYSGGEREFSRYHGTLRMLAQHAGLWRSAFAANQPLFVIPITSKQATLVHLYSPEDYEPLVSRRLAHYIGLLIDGRPSPDDSRIPSVGALPLVAPPAHPRLLDMMSVRYIVSPPDGQLDRGAATLLDAYTPDASLVLPMDRKHLQVRVNGRALPRAYTVEGLRPVDDDAAAELEIVAAGFDPRREVVVTADVPSRAAAGELLAADIVAYAPEHVVVRTNAPADAVLVLTDSYAPGWAAAVDGMAAPIWPANTLFRAVAVPAGTHEVVFSYSAPGFGAARAAALLAVALAFTVPLLGLAVASRRVARMRIGGEG